MFETESKNLEKYKHSSIWTNTMKLQNFTCLNVKKTVTKRPKLLTMLQQMATKDGGKHKSSQSIPITIQKS